MMDEMTDMRLDQWLALQKHCATRSQAKLLIKQGMVIVNGKRVTKAGFLLKDGDRVELKKSGSYVGRGAQKLKAAVEAFKIEVRGKTIADCGASTGGFTDYLLQNGAIKSYCLDVGHDQLDSQLRSNERVINLENVNLKYPFDLPERVDLVVVDVSFISLRLVLPTIFSFLKSDGEMIVLFKPQFEVGKENVGKNGIVKSHRAIETALNDFKKWIEERGLKMRGLIKSPIEGKKGNREWLIWLKI